ncbi:pyruvate dehydrogenase E1 component [Kutzneria sp. 744]|nr:pyruvate dehydrogenase E1 component [Kutzneria sp. 744]
MTRPSPAALAVLIEIERRVLWLSTAVIHHANLVRPNTSGLKVGGHQASSASMVSIMTSLWFRHLRPQDRVSVKPHASPVLHAINYLLGELDESYLTTLRAFGGLQSYPSRSKDPDPVDYSTGSVGIGATAPIWGAIARRYVGAGSGRQYSLLGDAELDEGAVWEAVLDPSVAELGEIVWIVDLNRQSLDRVVPQIAADRLHAMFAGAGWQVITLKYGRLLEELFTRPGGPALRERIDTMPNPEYQRLLRCDAAQLRDRLPAGDPAIAELVSDVDDGTLVAAVRNLGGHDLAALDEAFEQIEDTRPTVILAYTVKGNGLPTQGHPQNHSSLLTTEQLAELARRLGRDVDDPWQAFPVGSDAAVLCEDTANRLRRKSVATAQPPSIPLDFGRVQQGTTTTQAALGRTLLDLTRRAPDAARRVVTVSPDVSSSTNLGGWVNKVGVWSPDERVDWFADDADTILHWRESPGGQHIELGIAETNLVGLIGELGATWSRWGEPLLPIGVLYDPFVSRALEPWSFGIYAGGQSILVGTPSGVTLAPGRRRAPVHHDALHRTGAARLRHLRAGVRHRRRVDAAGQPGPAGQAGRHLGLPTAVDPTGRPVAGRRVHGSGRTRASPSPGRGGRVLLAPQGEPGHHHRRDGRGRARGAPGRRAARPGGHRGRRRLRDQPRPAVPGPAGEAGSRRRPVLDPGPGAAADAAGDRAGRSPAHARLPGHREPGGVDLARRHTVRPGRLAGGRLPLPRSRRRQHRARGLGPQVTDLS